MHYLKTFEQKGKGLANSVALAQRPELKEIFDNHFKTKHKDFIKVLSLLNYTTFEQIKQILDKLLNNKHTISFATISLALNSDTNSYESSRNGPIIDQTRQNLVEYSIIGVNNEQTNK